MKSYIPLLMLFFLPVSMVASAEEYSAKSIAAFTRFLIDHKEYYRALVELKRLGSMAPGYISPLAYRVTENYLLFRGKQYRDILGAPATGGDPLPSAVDSLFRYDAAAALHEYGTADQILGSWGPGAEPFLDRCLKKRKLYSLLQSRRYTDAAALCDATKDPEFGACRELIEQARLGLSRERKPWLAAVLGIVPGMGYMYAGEYATGIFAFFLIAADAVMTYFAFRSHNTMIGCVTGVIGGFFYAGSIAGGYLAAQRFNLGLADQGDSGLAGSFQFDRDRDEVLKRHGIGGQ